MPQGRTLAVLVLAAAALFYLRLASDVWLISPDSTDYVEGAQSLARGDGYRYVTGAPQTYEPPGTAAIYTIAAAVPSAGFIYFNVLTKLLAIGFIVLNYLVVRRSAGAGAALIVTMFLSLSQLLIAQSARILSDIPFSALFLLTLWRFPEERLDGMPILAALTLGAMVACCYVVRTAGLFIYLGYAICIATTVRRNRLPTLAALTLTLGGVAVALWIRAKLAGSTFSAIRLMFQKQAWVSDSGTPGLMDWWDRVARNAPMAIHSIDRAVSNQEHFVLASLVIALLIVAGAVAEGVRRRVSLHMCFLAFYVPMVLLQPYAPENRYFLPILPLLGILAASGAHALSKRMVSSRARWLLHAALIAIFAVNPFWSAGVSFARDLRRELHESDRRRILYQGHEAFLRLVDEWRDHLTPSDVVATMHANILRYFVPPGTRVSNVPLTNDVDKSYAMLRAHGTTQLFCDKKVDTWRFVEPMLRGHADGFELIAENEAAAIYRFKR